MTELQVSKKNISELLNLNVTSLRGKKYVVPEYQRPYRWDEATCDVLWNDLVNFFVDHQEDGREYFLGSIVTCRDSDDPCRINIIDGQQRITSLLLLLRAFYYKLEKEPQEMLPKKVEGLMRQIGRCIWKIDCTSEEIGDPHVLNFETLSATDNDKDCLYKILETGEVEEKPKTYYGRNYKSFLRWLGEFAATHTFSYEGLLRFILDRCIVLPIECSDLDAALTIFGTLNTRGLPLSDSDIFKAELYKRQRDPQVFAERWKELEESVEIVGLSVDDLFRYYMYIDRAKNGKTDKEQALRAYYFGSDHKYALFTGTFFEEIVALGEFWKSIYSYENTYCDDEGLRYIQCLFAYPNEYWKYPVSVFFYKYKGYDTAGFRLMFTPYLKKLLAFMFVKFIERPTVNAVKPAVFSICVSTYSGVEIDWAAYVTSADLLSRINDCATWRIAKGLLLLNTYLSDASQKRISSKMDIEHIFPRSWQDTCYNGWERKDADTHLEMFGNKIILERTLNIQAGNGYFKRKKERYKESKIREVQALAALPQDDWQKEDIERRNEEILQRLCGFFCAALSA